MPSRAPSFRVVVAPEDGGKRLDQLLAARVPNLSRRKARVLLDIGGVFVDGARVKVAGRLVRPGQVIEAHLGSALERAESATGRAARERDAERLPRYEVVFEDADLVVVDKPAGLLTAPTPESDRGNLADLLGRRTPAARIYVVHRIDLQTSGLLVFAKSARANRELAARFRDHDITRSYDAFVLGRFPDGATTLDASIGAQRAVTHATAIEHFGERATRVSCTLETGRTHQIRIHCAGAGHPILGDPERAPRLGWGPPRMALHAHTLGFRHPASGEALLFEADLPEDLAAWAATLAASTR
jgi:23S rRNA pseudouridine1911/1915/1917 synthase